jgi:hypothetical protein
VYIYREVDRYTRSPSTHVPLSCVINLASHRSFRGIDSCIGLAHVHLAGCGRIGTSLPPAKSELEDLAHLQIQSSKSVILVEIGLHMNPGFPASLHPHSSFFSFPACPSCPPQIFQQNLPSACASPRHASPRVLDSYSMLCKQSDSARILPSHAWPSGRAVPTTRPTNEWMAAV